MKWVTRERAKVDRIACPWLIRKFIDPQGEFLFVPANKVMDTAERTGAVASFSRACHGIDYVSADVCRTRRRRFQNA
jgi:hypothetical protein